MSSCEIDPQFGLKEEDALAAADLASRARTLPEIAAAETADLVYRELPFAVPMGEGVLATGQIDLAYRKAGKWTVIDFKTTDLPDAADGHQLPPAPIPPRYPAGDQSRVGAR